MEIQKTNLNEEKIKNILEKEYNIKVLKIDIIDRGTSNVFKIEIEQNKYILKEFISIRKKETIIKEINIINFLRERNINVPKYVKTKSGYYYMGNEGRIIIVQEFIEGYTIDNNTGDHNQVMKCANILGKLTKELMDYPELSEEDVIDKNFSKNRVHQGIEKMQHIRDTIKEDNKYKEEIEKDLNYRIRILEKIEKEFDFRIVKKLLVDYFKEFTKYISLNEYDLKYVFYLYLLQLASSTYGYKEYNDDYSQKELLDFAFFRTDLCKKIYENLETIGSKLIVNIKYL